MAITTQSLSGYRKARAGEGTLGKTCRRREKPLVEPGLPGRAGRQSPGAGKAGQGHLSSCLQGVGK